MHLRSLSLSLKEGDASPHFSFQKKFFDTKKNVFRDGITSPDW